MHDPNQDFADQVITFFRAHSVTGQALASRSRRTFRTGLAVGVFRRGDDHEATMK